jgi:hypothetical protein
MTQPNELADLLTASPNDTGGSIYDGLERCENCEELKADVRASKDGDVLLCDDCARALAPKPRKPRSDKGTHKPKPPEPSPLVDDLDAAVQRLMQATAALRIATYEHEDALTQYGRILQALKAK